MWIVTILTPLVTFPSSFSYESHYGRDIWSVEPLYLFLFGAYDPSRGTTPSGWSTGPGYLVVVGLLLFFFIAYALLVTIYSIDPRNKRWVIAIGVLSLFIPYAFAGFIMIPIEILLGAGGVFIGPLPFQFVLGLVSMKIAERKQEVLKDDSVEEEHLMDEKH
ncbi:MAG: hypothetical protein EAX87_11355 [Candidatus Thorarchaeota archaeon]|nr:hypothetical protein [Candidatus Thorarchaeota archaeon]